MILVTLAGSSFWWAFCWRRTVPVSFSMSRAEAEERTRGMLSSWAAAAVATGEKRTRIMARLKARAERRRR